MNIIYQEKDNECGACVVAMLANEINELEVERGDVVSKCLMKADGLTLFDLEELGLKFGLQIESYECEFRELLELNKSDWHVALVKKSRGLHYVVFQRSKKGFEIYDPDRGRYFLDEPGFRNVFAGVFCTVESAEFDRSGLIKNQKISWAHFLTMKMTGVCLVVQLLASGLGIAMSQLFKLLVDGTVGYQTTFNLVAIVAPFAIIKLIEQIGAHLVGLIQASNQKSSYKNAWAQLLRRLPKHSFHFYDQQPFGTVFELDFHVATVIDFFLVKMPVAVAAGVFAVASFGILIAADAVFAWIAVAQIASGAAISAVRYFVNKHRIRKAIAYVQAHNAHLTRLQHLLSKENAYFDYERLAKAVKINLNDSAKHQQAAVMESDLIDRLCEITRFAWWILVSGVGINLIVDAKTMELGDLMYLLSLQALLAANADTLVSFSFSLSSFRSAERKINGYFSADGKKVEIPQPSKITSVRFEGVCLEDGPKAVLRDWSGAANGFCAITGKNGTGKSSLLKALTGRFALTGGTAKINGVPVSELDPD